MKKIVGVHLLNDYSGSPLVFSTILKGLVKKGHQCDLHTGAGRDGFLSDLAVNYKYFSYRFMPNKLLRLFAFLWSQVLLFFNIIKYKDENVVVYINTLLPFGAALAGKWINKPVIYHIHEISVKPAILKRFLKYIANVTASDSIFVSNYLLNTEKLPNVNGQTVYNALSDGFISQADAMLRKQDKSKTPFTALMLCSLKPYKGVQNFVTIAKDTPAINFDLVLNAEQIEIDNFFLNEDLPKNLTIHPTQRNVHPFYQKADLVLNLSHPEQWVETFGMTLLEAMYYGVPCIAPPIGGPAEIVTDTKEGYLIDQRNIHEIVGRIKKMAEEKSIYKKLSINAKSKSSHFNNERMVNQVNTLLQKY